MAISGVSPLSLSLSPSAANHACSLSSLAYKRRDAATLRLTTGVLPPPRIEIDAPPPPRRASPPSTWRRWRGGTRRAAWRRREGEKSSGTWVDLEVRTSLRGSGRGEGGVLLYIHAEETPLYSRTGCAASTHTSTRAHTCTHTRATTLLSQLSSYASTRGRARARVQRSPAPRMQSAPWVQSSRIADSRNGGAPPPPSLPPPRPNTLAC